MTIPKVHLLHETNPRKYFPAIYLLEQEGQISLSGEYRYSVIKEWFRAWLRDRTSIRVRTENAWKDLRFRLSCFSLKDEIIIMGFAPWDWRILLYRHLARRNRIIYHTSWHDWGLNKVPRRSYPRLIRRFLQNQWKCFLKLPNVKTVAVTQSVAKGLQAEMGVSATVIPHAVPSEFFNAQHRERKTKNLKLLFVGEISKKKGVLVLLDVMKDLSKRGVELTIVGNGPLASKVVNADHAINYLGQINARVDLAKVMSEHDVLVLLSQRTKTWEELFGIVIVEAMATGMAIMASDHIGPREILLPARSSGLFYEDDISGIKQLLTTMAQDRKELSKLRQSQAGIAETYSIGSISSKWLEVIKT